MSVIKIGGLNIAYEWERMRIAGRHATESLGGGTGERIGRGRRGRRSKEGNDERVDELNGQGTDQGLGVNATEPKTIQKTVQIFGALTDEAVRNRSIKKVEKRGNLGEPSKDKNLENCVLIKRLLDDLRVTTAKVCVTAAKLKENQKWLNKALDEGAYQFEMFIPNNSIIPKLKTPEDLQGDALLHYDAEMELMNLILLSIP
ncbi:hypothetical protein Tco_0807236, partial [Tanacetum coccineum]